MRAEPLPAKKRPHAATGRPGEVYRVRVLFFEGQGAWSAQVLDYDIAMQASTLRELFYEVDRVLFGYLALGLEGRRPPFEGIPPAPKTYWDLFERSRTSLRRPPEGLRLDGATSPAFHKYVRLAESAAG